MMVDFVIGLAFGGLFLVLLVALAYIYILSMKLSRLTAGTEMIKEEVNQNTYKSSDILDRLEDIKNEIMKK